ncbi:MAG: SbmA/BacA-like family transporter, partial [Actinomycetes bacterium]
MGTEIDWSTEWLTSLVWIAGVFLAAVLGGGALVALLTWYTVWGRQFQRLAFPYFSPRGGAGWRPLLSILFVLFLAIFAVRLSVLLSYQGNEMNTALQELNASAFWQAIWVFGVLATVHVVRYLIELYVTQALIIQWRAWLTDHIINDWLAGQAYDRGRYTPGAVDNPDQRIQEDALSFPTNSVTLGVGAVSSLVSLVSFTIILWELSGPLVVFDAEVPRAMTFLAYIFVIIASLIAFRIGRPLIRLRFLEESFNAHFRYGLVRLRDNSETVAFHRGERAERRVLATRFRDVIDNLWEILRRTVKFTGW